MSYGNGRGTIFIMTSSTSVTNWLWQVNTMQLLQKPTRARGNSCPEKSRKLSEKHAIVSLYSEFVGKLWQHASLLKIGIPIRYFPGTFQSHNIQNILFQHKFTLHNRQEASLIQWSLWMLPRLVVAKYNSIHDVLYLLYDLLYVLIILYLLYDVLYLLYIARLFVLFSYNYKSKLYKAIFTQKCIYHFSPWTTQLIQDYFLFFLKKLNLLYVLYKILK